MCMEENKISIIMPTYNCARFIEETIESILKQTYSNWELIIVDDCSKDNTDEVVKKYFYPILAEKEEVNTENIDKE